MHPGCLWSRKGQRPLLTANSGRKRYSVLGGYAVTGEYVGVETDGMVNAETVLRWIDRLEAAFPEAERITVFVDNARYLHARLVKDYLVGKRVRFVYLPAYSPNLNLVERLWKFCKKKVLGQFYATYALFTCAITDFFTHLNRYAEELRTLMTEKFEILGCR